MNTLELEPSVIRIGWYDVRFDYAKGHRPAIVDLHKLAETLPHGSGLDGNWHVQVKRNGDVLVRGEYHQLDDSGSYDGWINFRFTIAKCRKNAYLALRGPCAGQYQVTRIKGKVYLTSFVGGGWRHGDYLYETISYPLSEDMGIPAMESGITVLSEELARTYTVPSSEVAQ